MEEEVGCGWLVQRAREYWMQDDENDEGWWEWEGEYEIVPCGAAVTELPNGWECAHGHSHYYDAEYFDDDEIAGRSSFPANARHMAG